MAEPGGVVAVEVVYAEPGRTWCVPLELARGTTAGEAVHDSGLLVQLRLCMDALGLGVYGRPCKVDRVLEDGDRVELYRPLQHTPKVARRLRTQGKPP